MKSLWLVRAAHLCAVALALGIYSAQAFMVARRNPIEAMPPRAGDDALSGSSSRDPELKNWTLQTPFLPMNNAEEVSFVQSSDDDDDDDDKDKGGSGEGGGESHEGHAGGEDSEKPKHEEHKAEGGEKDDKEEKEEKKHDDKGKDEKAKGKENLLTSPQEQSKFIRKSMNKAAKQSYKAMKKLITVMDALNGVVALLNQLVQLAPPSPPFAETVMIETSGKKVSLKGILDEAAQVRTQVDKLFTMLLSAKHAIIGSINHAIPPRPPTPPPPPRPTA